MRFLYDNICLKKNFTGKWLVVTGEITNISGKNFNAVVFRIALFVRDKPIGNATVTIRGFADGQTKTFEEPLGEPTPEAVPKISRYEIFPESVY